MPRSYRPRHSAARPSAPRRRSAAAAAATIAVCVSGVAGLAGASHADAATVKRNPIGSTPAFTASATGLTVTGWAADPDQPTRNLRVGAVVDGKSVAVVSTSLASPAATKKYGLGTTPGYSLAVPLAAGKHIVCVSMQNLGGGLPVLKRCVTTPLGRALTAKQAARRSPVGALSGVAATSTSLRAVGWTSDPDWVNRRSSVTMYVDGRTVAVRNTTAFAGTRPASAGPNSRFDITVPASNATHIVCVRVGNVGFGATTDFGCRAVDPRGTTSSTAALPATPTLNAKVVALAKKQIGRPYVWAAAGPKSFDCSGLVMWSYKKYGFATPRVSQDQIKSARLIPAARAVPGDLVFYHDSTGDVYHVGIYLSPGLSVAAIDTNSGVNYQRIWDTTATYGSFTHV